MTNLLRDEFKFDGLIMTDDLDMGAILNEYGLEETIRLAMRSRERSGHDLPPRPFDRGSASHAGQTAAGADRARPGECCSHQDKVAGPHAFSESAFKKIDGEIWDLRVAVLGEEEAAKRSPEDGKRSPVETY